jgi:hypothetical protein
MSRKVRLNEAKIKEMEQEHIIMLAQLSKIKDTQEWLDACSKTTDYLNKINLLKAKTENMRNGRPANGYKDDLNDFKILE